MIYENIHILPLVRSGEKEKKKKNSTKKRKEELAWAVKRTLINPFHGLIFFILGQGDFTASLLRPYLQSPGLFDPVHVHGEIPICFSSHVWGGF